MNSVKAQYAICQTPPWTRYICYIALTWYRPTSAQQHHQTLLGCHSNDETTSPISAIGTTNKQWRRHHHLKTYWYNIHSRYGELYCSCEPHSNKALKTKLLTLYHHRSRTQERHLKSQFDLLSKMRDSTIFYNVKAFTVLTMRAHRGK